MTHQIDTSHLMAIQSRIDLLSSNRIKSVGKAKIDWLDHRLTLAKKEFASELAFLGLDAPDNLPAMSDDDLLAALES